MIRFLFGRPGSGKTYTMVEEIRQEIGTGSRPVWLIVPEQMAYSAERDILQALPPEAGLRFSITSFSRLCDHVADQYGGRTQHAISRSMKSLLMWQNLRNVRDMLETYGHVSTGDSALCAKMLHAADELAASGVSADQLEAAAGELEPSAPLYGKLRDLALVTASYNDLVSRVFNENPADRLLRAAGQVEDHRVFHGSVVYIDGFSSFTMPEYAFLRPLMEQAAEVTISFSCEGRHDKAPHMASLTDSVRRLTRLCEDVRQPWRDVQLTGTHRTQSPELLRLEQGLWNFGLTAEDLPEIPPEAQGQVRHVVAPNMYEEAEAAALHLLELAAKGVPFGEMAVVVRDTNTWAGVLDSALEQYHIPYFLSARTDLNEKPAARLLLTALRCVARRWQAEDIITLLKTGLCGVSPREVDYFVQYVHTWRLTGRRMTEAVWSMNPDGYTTELSKRGQEILTAANRVRQGVMTPLVALEQDLKAAETVTDQCRALYTYLNTLQVREQLAEGAETLLGLGQVREAGEAVRLWSFLTETLATVASVMSDAQPLTAEEMGTALSLVFAETDIGSVPARHDCVTIGSAATLRADRIRAVLILGLNEGEFPQNISDDSLLSEQDKATLETLGIELDSRADRLMSEELLYIWRAMTLPTETLILSRSHATPDGQVRSPSAALNRVVYLLPHLKKPVPFSASYLESEDAARHRTPMEDRVSRPTARRLLGEEIWLSQSRLQTYARCPYSYYGTYILNLRERTEATFDNLGAGVFLHHVMEQYLRRALDEEDRIRPMGPEEVRALADAIMQSYIEDLCGDISGNGRLLHLFDRLRQVALVLIDNIQAELRQGAFTVAGLEWDTHGKHPGDPCPMVLDLDLNESSGDLVDDIPGTLPGAYNFPPDQGSPLPTRQEDNIRILLGGRIDRVDLYRAEDGETVYVRVIDYKSSKHEFSLRSMVQDMNIQLLLYLFTLCSPQNKALFTTADGRTPEQVLPASAVYISPDESDRDGAILPLRTGIVLGEAEILAAANSDDQAVYLPSVKRDKQNSLVGKGICSAAQIADLEAVLTRLVRDTAREMYNGQAARTPSGEACRFCRMKENCSACQG